MRVSFQDLCATGVYLCIERDSLRANVCATEDRGPYGEEFRFIVPDSNVYSIQDQAARKRKLADAEKKVDEVSKVVQRHAPRLETIDDGLEFLWSDLGSCQNYGPFLGTLNIRCRIILGTQKGTIILTTTHLEAGAAMRQTEASDLGEFLGWVSRDGTGGCGIRVLFVRRHAYIGRTGQRLLSQHGYHRRPLFLLSSSPPLQQKLVS